jgi:hypothetical protein
MYKTCGRADSCPHTKVPSRSCRQIGTRSSANRQANTTITTGLVCVSAQILTRAYARGSRACQAGACARACTCVHMHVREDA